MHNCPQCALYHYSIAEDDERQLRVPTVIRLADANYQPPQQPRVDVGVVPMRSKFWRGVRHALAIVAPFWIALIWAVTK
jgi:hypothetical protein